MNTLPQDLKFNRIRKCGSTNGSSPELARRQTAAEEEEDAENKIPSQSLSSSPLQRRSRAPAAGTAARAQSHSQSQSPSPGRPILQTAAAPHSPFAPRRPSPLVLAKNNVNTGM